MADPLPLVRRIVVRIERLLLGSEVDWDMLKVHADARPRPKASPHRVDQHICWFQMNARVRVTRLPALESIQRRRLFTSAADFDERVHRLSST